MTSPAYPTWRQHALKFCLYFSRISFGLEPATFFCQAYASRQKSAIENIDGRLQRDLSREIDIDKLSKLELQDIFLMHNLTPRKNLDLKTPAQAFLLRFGLDIPISYYRDVALHF